MENAFEHAAPERCEYCDRTIWFDPDQEIYVDRNAGMDCPEAPPIPVGVRDLMHAGQHEPA